MLNARIRNQWDRAMSPLGRGLGRIGITPNVVTLLGVLLQGVVAAFIVQGRLVAAGVLAMVAAAADALDGAVAKAQGRASKFGALLDSTTDRLSDALIFAPLAWLYGVAPQAGHDDRRIAALALVTLVASFLVSYVKARAEGLGYECNVGIIERAERLLLIIAGLLFAPLGAIPPMLGILTLLSIVTFVQRVVHVGRQTQRGS